jgi:hypothetical protein
VVTGRQHLLHHLASFKTKDKQEQDSAEQLLSVLLENRFSPSTP